MRHSFPGLTLVGIAVLLLSACGSGGGSGSSSSGSSSGGAVNAAPTANAGAAQTVESGTTVTLNGSASSDSDGTVSTYAWTQTAGSAVALSSNSAAQPTFAAPTVSASAALTFSLVVTDNRGTASAASAVTITVNPPAPGNVNLTGRVRYARPGFNNVFPFGLNYGSAQPVPARGIVVRARSQANGAVLATGSTDESGDFSLTVPNNTLMYIESVAQLLRAPAAGAPSWNVTVRDGLAATPYSHADAVSNSSSGLARNIDIPLGIGANGQATGTRASGPFAILDSIYQGIQLVLGAAPTANFPTLIVDWGSQDLGTFFTTSPSQHIALLADLTEDTDEFDRHVIAHEFGHYIERNFSRADNIGGPHGGGDRLDARVAFGEGFGYAFAAMVFNDPSARDSFVQDVTSDGVDNPVSVSAGFAIETNPVTTAVGSNDDVGCWCSESSVWSVLWDLYDANADTNDTLALGFTPLWNVLVGPQRTTPAFTTVFSFVSALKAARPGDAAAINTLVGPQNIVASTIEPFASTETHAPTDNLPPGVTTVLPLYNPITRGGGPVVLQTGAQDTSLVQNKLGNRRWLRLQHDGLSALNISVSSSANDPDFVVWRNGTVVGLGLGPPNPGQPEVVTINSNSAIAGTYLIDAYDCANGCSADDRQGATGQGNITLTVTVN